MNGPTRSPQQHKASGSNKPGGPLRSALIASFVVHIIAIVAMIVGLPHLKRDHQVPESISVEIATIADVTQTNKPPVKAPEPKEKKEEEPQKQPEKPKPPQSSAEKPTPPKPVEKVEPAKKEPEVVEKETPDVDELAPVKKVEKKPEKKPEKKAEPKKDDKKKPDEKKQEDSMNALLKNLTKDQAQPQNDISKVLNKATEATPSPETANVGENLTISDIDALRRQLSGCWNILGGAADAQDLAVDIRVIVAQDRTVKDASVVDQSRYNADDRFRAAAESALRAVRDPRCSPLLLPPEKYMLWRDMVINFDPKEML